ncbi:hypothetical protein AAFF_G00189590 [Aldrovandia affinis]|uniref:15-hydroxyprostaglandin dehydrogenase [NAD(+)] n=1 Tax=Aldrovandia affinis TaxID=143900 RepID=A0AAD7RJE6_9TELE|nr:hypothetical protein AAFF_G00189590 [Aldrovandia affinis]
MALDGKVALVTGAAQGLGKSFSDILLKNGAKVALLDVNEAAGKDLKASLDEEFGEDRTIFLACDVTSDEQLKDAFQKTIERFSKMDIVCNNAGIIDEKNWEKTVAINLSGVVRGTYLALQHMKKENGGEGGIIVNVASLAGLGPLLTNPIYTATKYGVVGFSRALAGASEVSGYGVRINVLCPNFAKTPLLSFRTNKEQAGQFENLMSITNQLMEKFGLLEVSTVAESFLQLVTDESKNGAVLMVTKKGGTYVDYSKTMWDIPSTSVPSTMPLTLPELPPQ